MVLKGSPPPATLRDVGTDFGIKSDVRSVHILFTHNSLCQGIGSGGIPSLVFPSFEGEY